MEKQETTFYQELQKSKDLDGRDNRGKQHDLSFILLGLVIGLLRKRDGKLSSIHRSMQNMGVALCSFLGIDNQRIVSRSQLPEVLGKVNLLVFEKLLFNHYGIVLSTEEKNWFAGDGKELKGSIEKGDKRGEAIVQLVRHKDKITLGQTFYNGTKESEKPTLRTLLKQSGGCHQKITADALHLCPLTTELIAQSGGIFLIGLKGNQALLLSDMIEYLPKLRLVNQEVTHDKGHGRIEKRTYSQYDISGEYFAPRWKKTGFKSLFIVVRKRFDTQTQEESEETSYYISNGVAIKEDRSYFKAIREHWSVEVNNHIRDVTLQEDQFKTKNKAITKIMSGLRTLVINILLKLKPKNLIAKIEFFQDCPNELFKWLRTINFL